MRKYIALLLCLLPLCGTAQDGVSTSLFTGRMSYSIPIYTVEDPDFHLEIALRYSTEGFKPFQPSGCYGQDWSLVAGGCITRFVQGIADEWMYEYDSPPGKSDYIEYGFMRAFDYFEDIEEDSPNKEQVFNLDSSVCDACGIYSPEIWLGCKYRKIDYMPDIFYFNFCGHKGHFMLNNSGNIVVLDGDLVKVDLSETKTTAADNANAMTRPYSRSKITIKTTDGYTYIFGGDASALEYYVYTKRNTYNFGQNTPAVSAWHLRQIIAPNGRTLSLNYFSTDSYGSTPNSLKSFCTDYDWSELINTHDSSHIVYSLHQECLLQSITTSDSVKLNVEFYAHPEIHKMYDSPNFPYCVAHSQLDSIIVRCNGDTLKKAALSYHSRWHRNTLRSSNENYWWRYLDQVKISGVGTYAMTYNNVDLNAGLPHPLYLSSYPGLSPSNDTQYMNMIDRFGFWKVTSLQGLLCEVSLPTGGKLKFTHEPHEFGEERRFRVVGTQDIELQVQPDANQQIGGARIKKIETFLDDSTLVETKTFSYNKKETNNSSGIFYNNYEIFYPSHPAEGHQIVNPHNYSLAENHIGYSYIEQTVTTGANTYKNAYTFYTGRSSYSSAGNNLVNHSPAGTGVDSLELRSGSLTFDGWMIAPGRLLKTERYTGNTLTQSVQYKYNGFPENTNGPFYFGPNSLGCLDTVVCLSKYSVLTARKLLVCPTVPEQVITNEYGSDGQLMMSTVDYTYDNKLRKKSITSTDSRGVPHFTRYTYPDDIGVSETFPVEPPLRLLTKAYRINTPVESVSGYIINNTEYITSGTINLYATGAYGVIVSNNTNSPAHISPFPYPGADSIFTDTVPMWPHDPYIDLVYYPYLHKSMSLTLSTPLTDYQPMAADGDNITYDSRYRLSCEYNFDWMYRPVFIKPFGKTATTYTWNGIYPVTKTIGNQTWTYTYKPYIGVSSMTDPRGITTYYTYDSSGRLIEEYQLIDGQKQILNVYQYHNKTE